MADRLLGNNVIPAQQKEEKAGFFSKIYKLWLDIIFQRRNTQKIINELMSFRYQFKEGIEAINAHSQKPCMVMNQDMKVTNLGGVKQFHFDILNNRSDLTIMLELHTDFKVADSFEINLKGARSYEEFKEAFEYGEKLLHEEFIDTSGSKPKRIVYTEKCKAFINSFKFKFTFRFLLVAQSEPIMTYQRLFNVCAEAYKDTCLEWLEAKKKEDAKKEIKDENGVTIGQIKHVGAND
jgi:hypothetical protein